LPRIHPASHRTSRDDAKLIGVQEALLELRSSSAHARRRTNLLPDPAVLLVDHVLDARLPRRARMKGRGAPLPSAP